MEMGSRARKPIEEKENAPLTRSRAAYGPNTGNTSGREVTLEW